MELAINRLRPIFSGTRRAFISPFARPAAVHATNTLVRPKLCCGAMLSVDSFREFFVTAGFRTDFVPMAAEEDENVETIRRVVVAEIKEISTTPVEGTNLAIFAGGDAAVLRLNEGPVGDDGRSKGYAVYHADQKWQPVKGRQGVGFRIENQFISPVVYDEHPDRWNRPVNLNDRNDVDGIRLL